VVLPADAFAVDLAGAFAAARLPAAAAGLRLAPRVLRAGDFPVDALVDRFFFTAMPDASGSQETPDYTYAYPGWKSVVRAAGRLPLSAVGGAGRMAGRWRPRRLPEFGDDGRVDAATDVEFGRQAHEPRGQDRCQVIQYPVGYGLMEGTLVAE